MKSIVNKAVRISINRRNRKRLINENFSLISSNCNGAVILHDPGLKFQSPFVNRWIPPKDYVKMLKTNCRL